MARRYIHRFLHGHWPQRANVNGKDYACGVCSAAEIEAHLERQTRMEHEIHDWNRQAGQRIHELEVDE